METFDFPYFTWTVRYPESSTKVRFGRGYEFASKPKGPDQVTYILHFKTMKFFEASPGVVSTTIQPKINIARLEAFYNAHLLYEKFVVNIPGKGNLTVRFAKPLEYKVAENGQGTVEAFTMEVLTQP
ncbi:hypothetical protein [Ensifer sp. ENS04]|uniref:hypothetical protein n=1 Tax=Ensifer sp. ENS04 TaxID=2769281 RepID=UPI001FEE471A|nr:hypothetical protein [Ensifer sp. ENS04]